MPAGDVTLILDLSALGVPGARTGGAFAPEAGEPVKEPLGDGRVRLRAVGLWAVASVTLP